MVGDTGVVGSGTGFCRIDMHVTHGVDINLPGGVRNEFKQFDLRHNILELVQADGAKEFP